MATGTVALAWSPLGRGALATGDGAPAAVTEVLDRLVAREGVGWADVAVAFVLAHPSRPVAILGSQDPDQVRAKLDAYRAVGIDAFILSGYPHLPECERFARLVLDDLSHAPLFER
jgi:predicted oxidoreductase